jgi:PAS domain S-box-containing protein
MILNKPQKLAIITFIILVLLLTLFYTLVFPLRETTLFRITHIIAFSAAGAILVKIISELTGIKKANERIKYQAKILSKTSDAIITTDARFAIKSCNKAAEKLYGVTEAGVIGLDLSVMARSLIIDQERTAIRDQLTKGRNWTGEILHSNAAGEPIHILSSISCLTDSKNNITDFIVINKDITDRIKLQDELQLMNVSLQQEVEKQTKLITEVFERVSDGFLAVDPDFRITYLNQAVEILTGKPAAALIGRNVLEEIPGLFNPEQLFLLKDALISRINTHIELFNTGFSKWFDLTLYPSPNGLSVYFKDITEKKRAEQKLRQSEEIYRTLVEQAHDVIGIADNTGTILQVNSCVLKIFGYTQKEALQMKLNDFLFEEDILSDPFDFSRVPASGFLLTQSRYKKKDGSTVYAELSSSRLPDGTFMGILRDFTERKKTEEELEKQKSFFEQMFIQSSTSTQILDQEGWCLRVNPKLCKLFGVAEENIEGHIYNIFEDAEIKRQGIDAILKRVFTEKITAEWEVNFDIGIAAGTSSQKIPVKQAKQTLFFCKAYPILNTKGDLIYVVIEHDDITSQKKREEELQRFASMIEASPAIVGTINPQGYLVYANKVLKDKFGLTENENITQININDFRTEAGENGIKKIYEQLLIKGNWIGENYYRSKNGREYVLLQVMLLHRNEKGEPHYISTTAIDITRQKEAEKEMQRLNKELRQLSNHLIGIIDKERKDIAREIHDELGQNLTVLKMDAAWIKKHLENDTDDVGKKLDELMEITNETIQTSRKLYNSLHPNMLEDIGLVAAIKWHAKGLSQTSGITINVISNAEDEKLPHTVNLALYRVYQECLTNILRHSKATLVNLNINKTGETIFMHIEDNGVGFDSGSVDIMQSHGLLSMRERMYALGGQLTITSRPGRGTTLEIVLSLSAEEDPGME